LAERYFREDPATALIKLRQFAELMAKTVAARNAALDPRENFDGVLRRLQQDRHLPSQTADLFHAIRRIGNTAAHENRGTHAQALAALKLAWQLGIWFHRSYGRVPGFDPGAFVPPAEPADPSEPLREEIEALRARLIESEDNAARSRREAEEHARAHEDLAARLAREAAERVAWEALAIEAEAKRAESESALAALQSASSAPQQYALLPALQEQAEAAAHKIEIDETDTRAIIDAQLRTVGWKADSETLRHAAGTRPGPTDAIAIAEWPTETGPVDYALFVKGRCVGVIEAKRQSKDVPAVLEQSQRYARAILLPPEATDPDAPYMHGLEASYRVPFVFATNGRPYVKQLATKSGIWFWDARAATNAPTALPEWFSPADLEEKLLQAIAQSVTDLAEEPFNYAGLRPYQQDAIAAVEDAVAKGQRSILVAMATGTGKTRTCIALMYRLLKHKRFRRILFLVDRTALGEQTQAALDTTELEGLLKFSQTYAVAPLDQKVPETSDRVQIATVQSLVKRILYAGDDADRPTPGLYDCIIVDEAHRGYTLDAEMREEDIDFRDTADYLSKYRRVLEYFDAVRIGLTATPALQTTEIFGPPVFHYGYRQAVIDGWLVDHLPARRIITALSLTGIRFEGGADVEVIDPRTGQIDLFKAEDTVDFEVQEFNKRVYTREFNRVVAEAVAAEVPPDAPGKTLLFAARDDHADMLVDELRKALVTEYGPQPHDLVGKITGSVDRPSAKIRIFRNDPRPKYVVTVDLLTTGIDVPEIANLVFVRRVNSRILYDQMIGRATRRCDAIGKQHFRIFDAVDIYANLQAMTDMRPVVVNPNLTLRDLAADLARAPTDVDRAFVRDQIVVRLRQRLQALDGPAREAVEKAADRTPEELLAFVHTAPAADVAAWLQARPRLLDQLDARGGGSGPRPGIFISTHADELVGIQEVFGDKASPEDYIAAFERFVRDNMNAVPALIAATQRPRELTRADLKSLAQLLDDKGFSEAALRAAYGRVRNADIAAHIIGFVRQAALGDPLVPYETRIDNALRRIESSRDWTQKQKQWLRRIGRALKEWPVGDRETLDQSVFAQHGGFAAIDRDFDQHLESVLQDLNDAIWGRPAA
jgi:type I restriction enzyme R subunit